MNFPYIPIPPDKRIDENSAGKSLPKYVFANSA